MHRNKLINLLEVYKSKPVNDISVADRFIAFIKKYPDCFQRSLQHGHVTGSAWVLNSEKSEALLTHHKKLDKWLQLGGHVDGKSDVLTEAIREVKEESGLNKINIEYDGIFDLDIHLIPTNTKEFEHYHYDVRFLLSTNNPEEIVMSDESNDLKWIKLKEIVNYSRESSILRMVEKCSNFQ